ncbi:hypothetical protein KCU66_g79, partial [Aureobasidium melanogenum]
MDAAGENYSLTVIRVLLEDDMVGLIAWAEAALDCTRQNNARGERPSEMGENEACRWLETIAAMISLTSQTTVDHAAKEGRLGKP